MWEGIDMEKGRSNVREKRYREKEGGIWVEREIGKKTGRDVRYRKRERQVSGKWKREKDGECQWKERYRKGVSNRRGKWDRKKESAMWEGREKEKEKERKLWLSKESWR